MKKLNNRLQGFTLIEILVTMIIMSTLVLIAAQILGDFYKPMRKYWMQSQLISDRINIEKSWMKNIGSSAFIEIVDSGEKRYRITFHDRLGKTVNQFVVSEQDSIHDFYVSGIQIKYRKGFSLFVGKNKLFQNQSSNAEVVINWVYNKNEMISAFKVSDDVEVRDERL